MLKLQRSTGLRFVDLYRDFVTLLEAKGVSGFNGDDVADVSSEEFDYRTQTFLKNELNRARLDRLFEEFRQTCSKNTKRRGAAS